MTGSKIWRFTTVVMDGSDIGIVSSIIDQINFITEEQYGKSTCCPLDERHPTMYTIATITDLETYRCVMDRIEDLFPGLCVFNPVI